MKLLKKYDYIWKFIIFIILVSVILTIINLVTPLKQSINSLISLIVVLLYSLFIGIKKGFLVSSKAYKEGFKIGIINIFILYILGALTLNFNLSLKKIIYYLLILITTILGSIIGINRKNSKI